MWLPQTPSAAFDAKNALAVTWTRTGKALGLRQRQGRSTLSPRRPATCPNRPSCVGKHGDAPAALQTAASVVEGEYRNDLVYHAQMEPLNAVAAVSPDGDACEVWCGVQSKPIAVTVAATRSALRRTRSFITTC